MKRRNFLKLLGVAVVAPGTVIAAIKAKPCKAAYKNTKFRKPIPYGIPYWVDLRTKNYNQI